MAGGTPKDFFGRDIVTVDDLERMTPAERGASFEESGVTDLSQVPPAFLAHVRARLEPLIAERDREQTSALRAPRHES